MQNEPLEHRIWIDAPLADVWQAWTDEESIMLWFAPGARVEPWVGGAFELVLEPSNAERHNTRGCKFIEVVSHERLTFEWKGPEDFALLMNKPAPRTQTTVLFVAEANGTRVQLIHVGWGEGPDWEQARSWHEVAWSDVLEALKRTLEEAAELREMESEDSPDEDEMGYEGDLGFDDLLRGESRYDRRSATSRTKAAPTLPGKPVPKPPTPPIPMLDEDFDEDEPVEPATPPMVTPRKVTPAKAASRPRATSGSGKSAAKQPAAKKSGPKKSSKPRKNATPKKKAAAARPKKAAPKAARKKSSSSAGRLRSSKKSLKKSAARRPAGRRAKPAARKPAAKPRGKAKTAPRRAGPKSKSAARRKK